ncbi:hypothetical protein [Citrobacter freundii]
MISSVNRVGFGCIDSFNYLNDKATPPASKSTSGQICPQTGLWKNESYKVVTSVDKGEVMPQYQGRDIDWEFEHTGNNKDGM